MKGKSAVAKCNIYTVEENIVMELEMPGVSKDNLDIVVEDNLLKITGNREHFRPDGDYLVREMNRDDYYQEYTLDETIDSDNIQAGCKNGVVTIELGIKESKKPRKITIS